MTIVLVLGDSIARGDGASTPSRSFVRLWLESLAPSAQTFFFCRGGATVLAGADWAPFVWCEPAPAYILVAYGMNDQTLKETRLGRRRRTPRVSPSRFGEVLHGLVETLNRRYPAARIVLMASAPPHADWEGNSRLSHAYRDRAAEVAATTGAVFADGLSAWEDALQAGADQDDLYENGANHPSDLGHRILADALIAAVEAADAGQRS
jgi:lysophospholipase L1-like esterase